MTRWCLVVEDESPLGEMVVDNLVADGMFAELVRDGRSALERLERGGVDLVILDIMLPGPSGLELLRGIRAEDQDTPVLLLTARGDEGDRVLGLELGADDYVTKPFSLRELLARVRAHLRRRGSSTESAAVRQFQLGAAQIDLDAFTVRRDAEVVSLSPKEAAMLALLRREAGRAVSRARFLEEVWGGEDHVGGRTVDTHVLNLRQKIEVDARQPRHIQTVHGVGYRLHVEPAP